MTGLADEILVPLLRATVLLAVSAVVLQGLIWWLRPSSPGIQRAGWFLVLLQGVVLFHLPVKLAWLETRPPQPPAATVEHGGGVPYEAPPAVALPPPPPATIPSAADAPAVYPSRPTAPSQPAESLPWALLVMILWLAGVVCLPLLAGLAYVRFLWRLRLARPAPESWLREWRNLLAAERVGRPGDCPGFRAARDCPDFRAAGDCPDFRAAKVGLSPSPGAAIPLRVTDDVGPAMCWTPRGYRVFVPERIWGELTASQRAAVLRHELAHLRRGDLWKTLLERLLALPHWFNPFAWWAAHRFTECAEWACDQAAAGPRRSDATDYARALLRLGAADLASSSCATAARGGSLFVRIRRVISARLSEDSLMKKATILLAAAALVALNVVRVELVAREPAAHEPPKVGGSSSEADRRTDRYGAPLPSGALTRMGTPQLRHEEAVLAVAFSPGGKTLASTGQDGTIRLWSMSTGALHRQLKGTERGTVFAVAFSPDGTRIASGRVNGIVRLWDVATGNELFRANGHKGDTWSVAFSPDGNTFVSAGTDGVVCLWDVATGTVLRDFATSERSMRRHSVAISPDGKILASGTGKGTIRLWKLATGGEPTVIKKAHGDAVISLAFTPDGQSLISGGSRFKSLPHNVYRRYGRTVSEIRFWEVSTGRLLRELQAGEPDWGSCSLALSKDGKMLAAAYQDKIRIWQVASGRPIRKIVRPEGWRGTRTHGLAFSPDGTMLACAGGDDKAARLWDLATGKPLLENSEVHAEDIRSVSYSPDGKLVATGSYRDQTVLLWDAATGGQVRSLSFSSSSFTGSTVNALTFSPDGRFLVAGGCVRERRDELKFIGGLKTWDVAAGKSVREVTLPHRVSAVALSSDGKTLAAATWNLDWPRRREPAENSAIYVWKAATGDELCRLTADNPFRILDVAFSPDNMNLVSVDETSDVIVWDLSTGKLDSKFTVRGGSRRAALSPNAKHVATCGYSDSTVLVWEAATGKVVSKLNVVGSRGNALAYSPDGKVLATGSRGTIDTPKRYHSWIQLWDVTTGNRIAKYEAPYETASRLAFSPDGKALVSGMRNGSALVWDVAGTLDNSNH